MCSKISSCKKLHQALAKLCYCLVYSSNNTTKKCLCLLPELILMNCWLLFAMFTWIFNRKPASGSSSKKSMPGGGSGGGAGMWKFYSEDSPGIKVQFSVTKSCKNTTCIVSDTMCKVSEILLGYLTYLFFNMPSRLGGWICQ